MQRRRRRGFFIYNAFALRIDFTVPIQQSCEESMCCLSVRRTESNCFDFHFRYFLFYFCINLLSIMFNQTMNYIRSNRALLATTTLATLHFTSTFNQYSLFNSFTNSTTTTTSTTLLSDNMHILQMNRNHRKPRRGNGKTRPVSNYARKIKAMGTKRPNYKPAPYRPLVSKPAV